MDHSSPLTPSHPAIEIHDLCVAYNQKPVLWNIDLTLPTGKLIAVVGPNGAGKSTLLKSILGLVPTSTGSVRILGQPATDARTSSGYVPQRESVDWDFPISALDVVLMGRYGKLGWIRRPSRTDRDIALACLRQLDMDAYADRQISQLSGGQQQRVFLARALAQEAPLYLMDEPFAGIDATTEQTIINIMRELRSQGRTIIAVHHDLQTVPEYFDWALLLNFHVIACGETRDVFTTENLHRTFGGRLTILDQVSEAVRTGTPRSAQETSADSV